MYLFKNAIFMFLITTYCYALSCRSDHGGKEEEIRKAYNNCKKQMNTNSSNSVEDSRSRGYYQRNQWEYENRNENRENRNNEMGNRNNGKGNRDRNDDSGNDRYNTMISRNGGYSYDNVGRMDDRRNMYNRNEGSSVNGFGNGGGRNRNNNNDGRNEQISGRDDFLHSEELTGDISRRYNNQYGSRRFRREKRPEMNSGQRSQYNPHSQRSNDNDNGNSSSNSSKEVDRACLLHCVFENLHVTDDNGMPDRYLMTHSFTMDKKNEDVRDFVQETVEECYQLADNENTEDKCEFSMNLVRCFVEKEKANCDDFKELHGYLLD